MAASALLAPLAALVGAALGAVLRHGAAAVVGGVLALLMLPLVVSHDRHWSAVIAHALPFNAWTRLVDIGYELDRGPFRWTLTGEWTVYAGWALAAVVTAVVMVDRRDL